MKKIYVSPITHSIKIDNVSFLCGSVNIPESKEHCSACKFVGGYEVWHCTHLFNEMTGKPFIYECDYYDK